MKPIGAIFPDITFAADIKSAAAALLMDCAERARGDFARLGYVGEPAEKLIDAARVSILQSLPLTESPIEQIMLVALALMVVPGFDCLPAIHDVSSGEAWPVRPIVVVPQFVIARYRLDFLVVGNANMIAVECDGREFHDSRQQRQNDADRDDYLTNFGIRTVRYSGSWLTRNGLKAADEISHKLREPLF